SDGGWPPSSAPHSARRTRSRRCRCRCAPAPRWRGPAPWATPPPDPCSSSRRRSTPACRARARASAVRSAPANGREGRRSRPGSERHTRDTGSSSSIAFDLPPKKAPESAVALIYGETARADDLTLGEQLGEAELEAGKEGRLQEVGGFDRELDGLREAVA